MFDTGSRKSCATPFLQEYHMPCQQKEKNGEIRTKSPEKSRFSRLRVQKILFLSFAGSSRPHHQPVDVRIYADDEQASEKGEPRVVDSLDVSLFQSPVRDELDRLQEDMPSVEDRDGKQVEQTEVDADDGEDEAEPEEPELALHPVHGLRYANRASHGLCQAGVRGGKLLHSVGNHCHHVAVHVVGRPDDFGDRNGLVSHPISDAERLPGLFLDVEGNRGAIAFN